MEQEFGTKGCSVHVDMWGVPSHYLNDIDYLALISRLALEEANVTVLDSMQKQFSPNGVTIMFMLQESSFDIHTYPEKEYMAINIHTCGERAMPNIAVDYLVEELRPDTNRIYRKELVRGVE